MYLAYLFVYIEKIRSVSPSDRGRGYLHKTFIFVAPVSGNLHIESLCYSYGE